MLPTTILFSIPNPAHGFNVNLAVYTAQREDINILMYDRTGKKIFEKVLHNAFNQTYQLELPGEAAGMYFLKIVGPDFVRSKKLVIY